MNLLNSIKSMLQAVGSKTASDKANKGVMLVKTNGDSAGEPAGYVTKEVLAEIVRQELFSILSNDGSAATTLSKFIGLDGSSMKSITAGNLASVLGEVLFGANAPSIKEVSLNDVRGIGVYKTLTSEDTATLTGVPSSIANAAIVLYVIGAFGTGSYITQILFQYTNTWIRRRGTSGVWSEWKTIATT